MSYPYDVLSMFRAPVALILAHIKFHTRSTAKITIQLRLFMENYAFIDYTRTC